MERPRECVIEELEAVGLSTASTATAVARMERPRSEIRSALADPFLLEDSVRAVVRGRHFSGEQRAMVESKVAALHAELESAETPQERREHIESMLPALEEGLKSTVELQATIKRFRPAVTIEEPTEALGAIVPIRAGSRIVYRVDSAQPSAADEEIEPMVFHVLGVGASEAVLLFSGGVHGMRHLRDLEQSVVHNAWFANRERVKSDATAPWIGRALFRTLEEHGKGEIIIHLRRDMEPIAIERVGEGTHTLDVQGEPREVPVVLCRTARGDDLVVLDDPESPLVLRLEERGAELIRTIEAIL